MRDRLFLTVAARTDQNSAFGTNFQHVLYPKASLSWLVVRRVVLPAASTGSTSSVCARRTARAACSRAARRVSCTFAPGTVTIDGRSSTTGHRYAGADARAIRATPNLKPERSAELETGFETQLLNNRVHLDYTFYNKTTHDALINVPIARVRGRRRSTQPLAERRLDAELGTRAAGERAADRPPALRLGRDAQRLAQHGN